MGVQRCQQEALGLEAGPSQWPHQAMPPSLLLEHLLPETLQVIVCTSADLQPWHVVCSWGNLEMLVLEVTLEMMHSLPCARHSH